jgi:hypothetical protein
MIRRRSTQARTCPREVCRQHDGCGNAREVYDDLIECGIDAYQSLEVKAALDVVELKKKYKNRLAFVGNIDVRDVLTGDKEALAQFVLRRLNAAKGGGYIPMSDHSVPDNVPVENYDFYVELLTQYGNYPLKLGEHDISELTRAMRSRCRRGPPGSGSSSFQAGRWASPWRGTGRS